MGDHGARREEVGGAKTRGNGKETLTFSAIVKQNNADPFWGRNQGGPSEDN